MTGTGTENAPSTRGRRRKALVVAGIALLTLFGASFAANIDINSGTEVEFGQGIEQILACDSAAAGADNPGVTVTLTSSDPEPTGPGGALQFSVDGLVVSDIDALCEGKILTVGLYDDAGVLQDQVVFELESAGLTADPYRAGAIAGDTTTGCDPSTPPAFPDGSPFSTTSDCFPSTGANDGLAAGINAQDVSYVALETSDPTV